ncbi:MAG: sulfatase-like hydrolase/transferase [Bacillota bacterium]
MIKILEKINKLKKRKEKIINSLNNNQLDIFEINLNLYKKELESSKFKDIELYSFYTILNIHKNKLNKAKEYVKKGLEISPLNFDLLFNYAYIYELENNYRKALDYYLRAERVFNTESEKKELENCLERIRKKNKKAKIADKYNVMKRPNDKFPLKLQYQTTKNGNRRNYVETYIENPLFKKGSKAYYTQYYNEEKETYNPTNLFDIKTEILFARKQEANIQSSFIIEEESVLPISISKSDSNLEITCSGEKYEFNNDNHPYVRHGAPKRFSYFPVQKGRAEVKVDNDYIISDPIKTKKIRKGNLDLVLSIFIDGLANSIIEKIGLKNLMPNTYRFFNKGTIFNNCYANGGWTLPSAPTFFTGKHITNHKIFHPDFPYDISFNNKLISEQFQENDYLTFQISGNWRMTPNYGYVKGFDRTIFKKAIDIQSVTMNFMEHMRAFKNRENFIFLSIFDLHHFINGIPDISNQIKNSLEAHDYNLDGSKKSPFHDYDENKIERYINEIRRIDFYLKLIFDYIKDNYADNKFLISLFSDHGKGFLSKNEGPLIDERAKVPFMIRGKNIKAKISEEMISNIDIYPTILEKSNIQYDNKNIDGSLPKTLGGENENKYVYSESIYPGQTYKAVIRDKQFKFEFESGGEVQNDGRFEIGKYSNLLTDKESGEIIEKYDLDNYLNIVFDHIKDYILI